MAFFGGGGAYRHGHGHGHTCTCRVCTGIGEHEHGCMGDGLIRDINSYAQVQHSRMNVSPCLSDFRFQVEIETSFCIMKFYFKIKM